VGVSLKTIDYLFPVYLYPAPGEGHNAIERDHMLEEFARATDRKTADSETRTRARAMLRELFPKREYPRWPNLDPFLLDDIRQRVGLAFVADGSGDLKKTFGPEDVFAYVYALLHCPTYRSRYEAFLKRDFPRIPITSGERAGGAARDGVAAPE